MRWRTLAWRKTLKTGMLIASGPNVKRGKALETAHGHAGGIKL
jgi:hypothetical protein